jgi:hypothetical protein
MKSETVYDGERMTKAWGSLVPLAGSLFALSEIVGDLKWRLPLEAGLLIPNFGANSVSPQKLHRLLGVIGGAFLLMVGWRSHAGAWLLLGLGLLVRSVVPGPRTPGSHLPIFALSAGTTMGLVCLYLHGPVLWEWPRLLELLRVSLDGLGALWSNAPSLLPTGELVYSGSAVHLSALSVLEVVPVLSAVLLLRSESLGRSLLVGVTTLVASCLLKGFVVFSVLRVGHPGWLVHPAFQGPFLVAAGLIVWFLSRGWPNTLPQPARRARLAPAYGLLAAVGLWVALEPPGVPSPRRLIVAIDDAHGAWERTDLPFDTKRYGRDTVYTYTLLGEWLGRRHEVVILSETPIQPQGDVLLIKMPVVPFSPAEMQAIISYVRDGGGLLVFGDHTNLFGSSTHLNALLAPLGLRLREDAAIPFEGVTRRFSPQWYNGGPLVPRDSIFDFATSATIASGSLGVGPLIVDMGVLAEKAQYSNERNFGDLRPTLDDRFPPLVTAATVSWGKGRVVILADSTPWSNFSFFAPGAKEVVDRALRLAASPGDRWRRFVFLLITFAILVAAIVVRVGVRPLLVWTLTGYAVLTALLSSSSRGDPPTPLRPGAEESSYIVDAHHSLYRWDSDIRTLTPRDRDTYSTFFAWTSRVGLSPEFRIQDPFADPHRPVMILNPSLPFTPATQASVESYVRRGGRLLLLDDPLERPGTTAADLLAPFGISYQPQSTDRSIHAAGGPPLPSLIWALPLSLLAEGQQQPGTILAARAGLGYTLLGVTPVWVDEHGLVVYGTKAYGAGSVRVFIRSSALSQLVLGDVWGGVEPGRPKEQLYNLEYRLLTDWYPGLQGDDAAFEGRNPG